MRETSLMSLNHSIHLYIWDDVTDPIGVVQLYHGVNEHGLRYNEFAEFLNKQNYVVYMHDYISQGKSRVPGEEFVYFGKNGLENLKAGGVTVYNKIKLDYDNLPIYAFGHSLGAGLLRYILMDSKIVYNSVILNGTGYQNTSGMGLIIAYGNVLKLFKKQKPSKFFDNIFRQTQYKLKEKVEMNHFIEWLTRDKEKTEINKNDPYLYIRLSVSVFVDILKLFKCINNDNNIKNTNKDTKIMVMSGTHDPATNFGEGTTELYSKYQDIGMDAIYRLYTEGRHDTLQETNRQIVFNDIVDFIRKK